MKGHKNSKSTWTEGNFSKAFFHVILTREDDLTTAILFQLKGLHVRRRRRRHDGFVCEVEELSRKKLKAARRFRRNIEKKYKEEDEEYAAWKNIKLRRE